MLEKLKDRIQFRNTAKTEVERMLKLHKTAQQLIGNQDQKRAEGLAVEMYRHWGDDLDDTRESFVRATMRAFAETPGNVLLSSASLLTFILGAVAEGDKERRVWCLEHDAHWTNTIRSWIARYSIKGAYIIRAPIAVIGGMVRYQIMTRHLPKNITMVVCERTGAAPGATLSTLVTVGPHLAPEFTILARRVDTNGEAPLIKRWATKHSAQFVVVDAKEGFIKISRRAGMRADGPAVYSAQDIQVDEETATEEKAVEHATA